MGSAGRQVNKSIVLRVSPESAVRLRVAILPVFSLHHNPSVHERNLSR